MTVWWLASGINSNGPSYSDMKNGNFIGQGFPKIRDLSVFHNDYSRNGKFNSERYLKKIINFEARYFYINDPTAKNGAGRILCNLLKMEKDDLVVICDGTTVKGIAKIPDNPTYQYDDSQNYAHRLTDIVDWKDWDETKSGFTLTPPAQGVNGIQKVKKMANNIKSAWNVL